MANRDQAVNFDHKGTNINKNNVDNILNPGDQIIYKNEGGVTQNLIDYGSGGLGASHTAVYMGNNKIKQYTVDGSGTDNLIDNKPGGRDFVIVRQKNINEKNAYNFAKQTKGL